MLTLLLIIDLLMGINSATCKFRETVTVEGEKLQEEGYFYFSRGQGIRWDYTGQEKKTFLFTRGMVWEYYPEENFLRKYRPQTNFWVLMENPQRWQEVAQEIREKNGKIFVKLRGGEEVEIEVKNGKIRRIRFADTVFEFTSCRYNTKLPSSLFQPTFLVGNRKK